MNLTTFFETMKIFIIIKAISTCTHTYACTHTHTQNLCMYACTYISTCILAPIYRLVLTRACLSDSIKLILFCNRYFGMTSNTTIIAVLSMAEIRDPGIL